MAAPKLVARLGLDAKQFNREVRALKRQLGGMGRDFSAIGRGLTAGLTVPIVAGLGHAGKSFFEFDGAMTKSLAIMGDVGDEMRGSMSAAARQVALDTKFSADQAAESYFFLASAGLSAAQSIEALPKVSKFAQAGAFDMALATDLLTDAQSALGLTVKDTAENTENMARVSDVLVKANTLANASVEQFSSSLTNKAAAAMRGLGMEVEEGVAILAAFADQGTKGEEAGTALHMVLRDLQTASRKNNDEWERMNINVYDAQGEFRPFAAILGDLEGALEGASDEQRAMTLATLGFKDKSVAAIAKLLGLSDGIDTYHQKLKAAGGTTEDVANRQLAGLQGVWQRLTSTAADLQLAIGEQLMPVFERLATWVTEKLIPAVRGAVDWFAELPEPVQNAGLAAVALLAALGPLLIIFGSLAGAATALLPALIAVAGALAGPAGIVFAAGAAAAAVGGFIYSLTTNTGQLKHYKRELSLAREQIAKLEGKTGKLSGTERALLATWKKREAAAQEQIETLKAASAKTEAHSAAVKKGIEGDIAWLESQQQTTAAIKTTTAAVEAGADAQVAASKKLTTREKANLDHRLALIQKHLEDRQRLWDAKQDTAAAKEDAILQHRLRLIRKHLDERQKLWDEKISAWAAQEREWQEEGLEAIQAHFQEQEREARSGIRGMLDAMAEVWTPENIGGIFARAFEGGGGFMGAIKSTLVGIGQNVASHFSGVLSGALNMVPLVGPLLAQFGPALIAGIGKLAGKVWGSIKRLFGGADASQMGRRDTYHGFRQQAETDLADVSRYRELVDQQLAEGQNRNVAHAKAAFGYYAEQAGKTWQEGYRMHDRFLGAVKAGNQSTMDSILVTVTTWQAASSDAIGSVTEDFDTFFTNVTAEQAPALTAAMIEMFEKAKVAGAEFAVAMDETFTKVGAVAVQAIEGIISALDRIPRTIHVRVIVTRTGGGGSSAPYSTPRISGGASTYTPSSSRSRGGGGDVSNTLRNIDRTLRSLPSGIKRGMREGFAEAG